MTEDDTGARAAWYVQRSLSSVFAEDMRQKKGSHENIKRRTTGLRARYVERVRLREEEKKKASERKLAGKSSIPDRKSLSVLLLLSALCAILISALFIKENVPAHSSLPPLDRVRASASGGANEELRSCENLDVVAVTDGQPIRVGAAGDRSVHMFDAFTFNNEFDMLRVHLDELFGVVDTFVIAEATTTFQGSPKPLWFNRSKYELAWLRPVLPMIRHVIVDDMPVCSQRHAWRCEYHQRNALRRAMSDVRERDVVVVGDVDEILRRETATLLKRCEVPLPLQVETRFHYYSLHWQKRFAWNHPNVASGRDLRSQSMEEIRQGASFESASNTWRRTTKAVLRNGGWHLSYFMNVGEVIEKLHSFSHTEYNQRRDGNQPPWDDPKRIRDAMCGGKDLFARDATREGLDFLPSNDDAPALALLFPETLSRFWAYGKGCV